MRFLCPLGCLELTSSVRGCRNRTQCKPCGFLKHNLMIFLFDLCLAVLSCFLNMIFIFLTEFFGCLDIFRVGVSSSFFQFWSISLFFLLSLLFFQPTVYYFTFVSISYRYKADGNFSQPGLGSQNHFTHLQASWWGWNGSLAVVSFQNCNLSHATGSTLCTLQIWNGLLNFFWSI